MTTSIDIHRIARLNVLKIIEGLSLTEINKIPTGFTGNIAWHIGHIVATQQGLIYRLSGNQVTLEQTFIDKYKKGTVPQAPIDQAELDFIKNEIVMQPERLVIDMEMDLFRNYTPYPTSFGNTIHSFDEALSFVNVHEGMHIGYLMALKRVVKNS